MSRSTLRIFLVLIGLTSAVVASAQIERKGMLEEDWSAPPLSKLAAAMLKSIHPSFLSAVGTGEELARNAPVIIENLRRTRDAIESLGFDAPVESIPYSFIQDEGDRLRLIRDLENVEYLVGVLRDAESPDEQQDAANQIERKIKDIDRIYSTWTGAPRPRDNLDCDAVVPFGGCRGACTYFKGLAGHSDVGVEECVRECLQKCP